MNAAANRAHWAQGIKKTKPRRQVLAVLEKADMPLTASQIDACLRQGENPLWLSTIYRVLDTFVEHEMLLKTNMVESGMAVYEIANPHHRHYAVCIVCHKIIPLKCCPLESAGAELLDTDFHVLGHRLQMYGHCAGCQTTKE